MMTTTIRALIDGRTWRKILPAKCGPYLMRPASSWLSAATGFHWSLRIWYRVASCKWTSYISHYLFLLTMPITVQNIRLHVYPKFLMSSALMSGVASILGVDSKRHSPRVLSDHVPTKWTTHHWSALSMAMPISVSVNFHTSQHIPRGWVSGT